MTGEPKKPTKFHREHQIRMLRLAVRGRPPRVDQEMRKLAKDFKRRQDKIFRKMSTTEATEVFLEMARTHLKN